MAAVPRLPYGVRPPPECCITDRFLFAWALVNLLGNVGRTAGLEAGKLVKCAPEPNTPGSANRCGVRGISPVNSLLRRVLCTPN